jgi:hypothetical protein
MPSLASGWFKQAPPATPVVRVEVTYRGDRAVAYLWFTRHSGGPLALVYRIASLLPATGAATAANLDWAHWDAGTARIYAIPADQAAQYVLGIGDRLVAYEFGLARSQVASAVATTWGHGLSLEALEGPSPPVPGLIIGGHGLPGKVYMSAYPATPPYARLIMRDAAGNAVGSYGINPASFSESASVAGCAPIAIMPFADYKAPAGGYAFSTGAALPQVASVTAVLPDGSTLKGGFTGRPLSGEEPYYWAWQVRYPREDASRTVTLLFRDAAGRVLGQVKTIPGKNPFDRAQP